MTSVPPSTASHPAESHTTFFRQGSWLIVATGISGLFMMGTQIVAQRWLEPAEWVVFFALLRVYLLLGVPSVGLQTVFAQQTAAAISAPAQVVLAATARAVLRATFLFWIAIGGIAFLAQPWLVSTLKIRNPAALWVTVLIGLASLWSPVLRGMVQGRQQFLGLGWALIVDGLGRFAAVTGIALLGGQAAGGILGALLGQVASMGLCAWLARDFLRTAGAGFEWGPWLRRVVPLTLGTGTVLLMTTADVVYVQSLFPTEQARFYVPAAMIGLALTTFATPLAAVMFPKVARSAALTRGSKAMPLALACTAALGAVAALACTLFPELPLRVIFVGNPVYWAAAPLVPWFAWALLPLIVANVLISSLLARAQFRVVPWVVLIGGVYLLSLALMRHWLPTLEPFAAFRILLGTMAVCNSLLLMAAVAATGRDPAPGAAAVLSA